MQNKKTLAIIMACHNRREHSISCLQALAKQTAHTHISIEIFLVDDGSSDGTYEAINTEFPAVHLISGDGKLFWNRGMHKSFSSAIKKGFDYYVWLNDDSILYDNSLDVLLTTSSQLKERGFSDAIVGSAMQDPVTHKFAYGGVKRYSACLGRVKHDRIAPEDEAIQCDASNGNCVLIPASVVNKIGNLDPIYLHRWGDHDYCFRALKYGCSVWLAPGYLGTCEENPIEGTWEDTNLPMMERFRKLNSPRGFQFNDYAVYLKRHRGFWWPLHLMWPYVKIFLQSFRRKHAQSTIMSQ